MAELLPILQSDLVYSQVPTLSSGDRGMLDLLAGDRIGRLCVIELKADEDLQLPMQALDYWIRVRALNADRANADGGPSSVGLRTRGVLSWRGNLGASAAPGSRGTGPPHSSSKPACVALFLA